MHINELLTENKSDDEILVLIEKVYAGKNVTLDTDTMTLQEIQFKMEAAARALGLANQLKDKAQKSKQLSRIMTNMNSIRAALYYKVKELDAFVSAPLPGME